MILSVLIVTALVTELANVLTRSGTKENAITAVNLDTRSAIVRKKEGQEEQEAEAVSEAPVRIAALLVEAAQGVQIEVPIEAHEKGKGKGIRVPMCEALEIPLEVHAVLLDLLQGEVDSHFQAELFTPRIII